MTTATILLLIIIGIFQLVSATTTIVLVLWAMDPALAPTVSRVKLWSFAACCAWLTVVLWI